MLEVHLQPTKSATSSLPSKRFRAGDVFCNYFVAKSCLMRCHLLKKSLFPIICRYFRVSLLHFLPVTAQDQQIIELNECIIIFVTQFSQDCFTIQVFKKPDLIIIYSSKSQFPEFSVSSCVLALPETRLGSYCSQRHSLTIKMRVDGGEVWIGLHYAEGTVQKKPAQTLWLHCSVCDCLWPLMSCSLLKFSLQLCQGRLIIRQLGDFRHKQQHNNIKIVENLFLKIYLVKIGGVEPEKLHRCIKVT